MARTSAGVVARALAVLLVLVFGPTLAVCGGTGRGGGGRGGGGRGGAHEATWHSTNKQGWWWGLSLSLTASHRLHVEKHM